MKVYYMNGAGNDFMVMDGRGLNPDYSALSKKLCAITGADGFMAVDTSETADFKLHFYNSDGSRGEMCGNGSRCICRFANELGIAGEKMTVETDAGPVHGWHLEGERYRVQLNTPTTVDLHRKGDIAYVELGNPGLPHAVIPYPDLKNADWNELRELGRKLRWNPAFPKGANVNFYELTGADTVYERTFERGVEDFTYACGTGTGSVVTVLTLQGKVSGKAVKVRMPGGELIIDAKRRGSRVERLFLTGPTNIVCKGQVTDEDLAF